MAIYKNFNLFENEKLLEFNFSSHITIITGGNGQGKTTLFNILKNQNKINSKNKLEINDINNYLITYRHLIFFNGEDVIAAKDFLLDRKFLEVNKLSVNAILKSIKEDYPYIDDKILTLDQFKELNCGTSERIFLNFLILKAIRHQLNIEIPLILDAPFTLIDPSYRSPLMNIFAEISNQVIVFLNPDMEKSIENILNKLPSNKSLRVYRLHNIFDDFPGLRNFYI